MRRIGREKIRRITKKKLRDGNIRRIICTCIWKEYKDGRINICKKKKKKMKTVTLVSKKYLLLRLRKRTKNEEENYFIPPLYRIYICTYVYEDTFTIFIFVLFPKPKFKPTLFTFPNVETMNMMIMIFAYIYLFGAGSLRDVADGGSPEWIIFYLHIIYTCVEKKVVPTTEKGYLNKCMNEKGI